MGAPARPDDVSVYACVCVLSFSLSLSLARSGSAFFLRAAVAVLNHGQNTAQVEPILCIHCACVYVLDIFVIHANGT